MKINFNPQRAEVQTTASIYNKILKYNDEEIDLSSIPNGATATSEFLTIDKNLEGNVEISMLWRYTDDTLENCFPKDLEITNGEIFPKESIK